MCIYFYLRICVQNNDYPVAPALNVLPLLLISSDMILRALVFSSRAFDNVWFGFFTRLPRVDLAQLSLYRVVHLVETGEACLII